MTRWLTFASLVTAFLLALPAAEADEYARDSRVQYITRVLDAVRTIQRPRLAALEQELYLGARKDCRAAFGSPTVGCVVELARKTCDQRPEEQRQTCHLVADVIATNTLGEREFVDSKARFALMNASDDFRSAMRRELRRRYAVLAGEMTLSESASGRQLPHGIDRFCTEYTHARGLTWQRCVAAIVWYIGTADTAE